MKTIVIIIMMVLLIAFGVYAAIRNYGYIALLCGLFAGSLSKFIVTNKKKEADEGPQK